MNGLDYKPTYKCRFPIIFFAWLALFFRVLHSCAYFVSYWDGNLHFEFPSVTSFTYWFVYLAIYISLAIFVTWIYDKGKASFILQIFFFLYATISLFSAVEYIIYGIRYNYISDVIFYLLYDIIVSALYTILAITSFKGSFNKIITILIFAISGLDILYCIIDDVRRYIVDGIYSYNLYIFNNIVYILGAIGFNLALFLFCMTNKIRPIGSSPEQVNQPIDFNALPPEQALKALNDSFQSGQISFEQYKATREEILKKL